jgi:hypothetical protein
MKASITAVLLGALGAMSACSQGDTSLGTSQGNLVACAPNDCEGKPVPQVQCANSSPTVSCERAGSGACSPVPHCDSADAGTDAGSDSSNSTTCTPLPCPLATPWNQATCSCAGGVGGSGGNSDGGNDSTTCAPLPCPLAAPWNQATCSCAGGVGGSGGKSDGGTSSPPPGGCNVAADCHGPLPLACVSCPNGSKNGCPHWTCGNAGLCVTAICD